ncbi:MAG: Crp/Fnr family transcriptional regulator [Nitrospirota bacterium]
MNETQEIISKIAPFSNLEKRYIDRIVKSSLEKRYSKGEVVFTQGEECDGFYIVKSGEVKVCKRSSEGREQVLGMFREGDFFGIVPLFDGGPYPANAEVCVDSVLIKIGKVPFLEIIKENPMISLNILPKISKRTREFTSAVENLSLKDVKDRLFSFILDEIGKRGTKDKDGMIIDLGMTHEEIAARLGTVREVITRSLSRLQKEGRLKIDDGIIIVPKQILR